MRALQVVHAVAVERKRLQFDACAALTTGADRGETSPILAAYCRLAEQCTAFSAAERPTAAQVVAVLKGLLEQCEGGQAGQTSGPPVDPATVSSAVAAGPAGGQSFGDNMRNAGESPADKQFESP